MLQFDQTFELVGGRFPIPISEEIIKIAKLAMKEYNRKEDAMLEVRGVMGTVDSGSRWIISMEAFDNCYYQAEVVPQLFKGGEALPGAVSQVKRCNKKDIVGVDPALLREDRYMCRLLKLCGFV